MSSQPPKGRLISQFETRAITEHGKGWSDLWDTGNSSLWDRGKPSPALIDLVEEFHELFNPFLAAPVANRPHPRKKALVPGCGRGYDVIALALHGFDAYGLEISATGVAEATAYAAGEMTSPQSYNFGKDDPSPSRVPGAVQFLQGDFFANDWTPSNSGRSLTFDLVYDYTFLCALHPSQRSLWAERMARLLPSGGLLVCLEFPMYKDPALPGPPWGVKGAHWALLAGEDGQGMFTRKVYVQPARTYAVGQGTDMISVYERK
ncbi:hypothetical protein ARAM_000911 [Aspergillus rambellii]|uniref:Thiol methyltransferase n=1 Tax=Aspergillus rambellii TaxID=308745 RepID=A0A0F8WQB7_9EURO|nr:hypothetical protein ARAM_000911 [Aspergillus rambellii]